MATPEEIKVETYFAAERAVGKESGIGPFVATIKAKHVPTNTFLTPKYKRFETMELARGYLAKGVLVIQLEKGFKIHRTLPEQLQYEDERQGLQVSITLAFFPEA